MRCAKWPTFAAPNAAIQAVQRLSRPLHVECPDDRPRLLHHLASEDDEGRGMRPGMMPPGAGSDRCKRERWRGARCRGTARRSWDVYYFSPGGAKFRSKAAVARELGLEPPTRGGRGLRRRPTTTTTTSRRRNRGRRRSTRRKKSFRSTRCRAAAGAVGAGVEDPSAGSAPPPQSIFRDSAVSRRRRPPHPLLRRAQGYGRAEDLWVPAGNILDKSLVRVFEAARSSRRRPSAARAARRRRGRRRLRRRKRPRRRRRAASARRPAAAAARRRRR